MIRNIFLFLSLSLTFLNSTAQNNSAYLKKNAVRINNPYELNDSIYNLLSPFQFILVGEMHGTNEPAQFINGLVNLLTAKGDSVAIGLEIPSGLMTNFILSRTDSSIYQSSFFHDFPIQDGRQSFAWANLISGLKNNPKVLLFFYDINDGDENKSDRDRVMYLKIKKQIQLHPGWKMVTLSGNVHNKIVPLGKKMASLLKQDKELNIWAKICSLNLEYLQGTCHANFGHGLEVKKLGHPASAFDTTFGFEKYLVMASPAADYEYTGFYYTRNITASEMVKDHLDIAAIKKELAAIHDRDQKTRTGSDSAAFMNYIDSCNLVQVESLVAKYGWLGKSFVGANGNVTLFLVIQHADLTTQEKYLPLLQKSVDEGESRLADLALLQDRVLMRQGKKQIYGSQVVFNKTGGQEFYPIEDEKNVNVRREKAGLQPIEEYAEYFNIDYKLPK